ncbi:flagellar basal body L-ring protein FlgH [Pseudorhodoplanes sp.]|uniref:flagellar basal body L-ring protein FlgH n=1 Tax=Pseudorhodoplanes sp. TaxID=1934341 RepID=UPI003D13E705
MSWGGTACLVALLVGLLAGCSTRPQEIGREPELSPVGSGLIGAGSATSSVTPSDRRASIEPARMTPGSTWRERGTDLFRDPRARRVGDIVTVTILMKDKASLDNSSKRSRDSSHGFGLDVNSKIDWRSFAGATGTAVDSAIKSNTASDGKGEIARSENIDLRVAAVVANVLPNGNLVIQGSQEIRVNYELRVLTFSGIVNVADIKSDNTISHDRIAEARMSYGGRGRMMEVQQPAWGHQVIDAVFPF